MWCCKRRKEGNCGGMEKCAAVGTATEKNIAACRPARVYMPFHCRRREEAADSFTPRAACSQHSAPQASDTTRYILAGIPTFTGANFQESPAPSAPLFAFPRRLRHRFPGHMRLMYLPTSSCPHQILDQAKCRMPLKAGVLNGHVVSGGALQACCESWWRPGVGGR
eukprot:gene8505-biopygen19646